MKKSTTTAEKILKYVKLSKNKGRSLKDIQEFVFSLDSKFHYRNGRTDRKGNRLPRARGYYATALYGDLDNSYNPGLLYKFCERNVDGRWVLSEKIEGPFYSTAYATPTLFRNRGSSGLGHGVSAY